MDIDIHGVPVNLTSAPAFMGHEELVLPMLVLNCPSIQGQNDSIGSFFHCLNKEFRPNDLSNTAVVGFRSGFDSVNFDVESLFAGQGWGDEWNLIPAVTAALEEFDQY